MIYRCAVHRVWIYIYVVLVQPEGPLSRAREIDGLSDLTVEIVQIV